MLGGIVGFVCVFGGFVNLLDVNDVLMVVVSEVRVGYL